MSPIDDELRAAVWRSSSSRVARRARGCRRVLRRTRGATRPRLASHICLPTRRCRGGGRRDPSSSVRPDSGAREASQSVTTWRSPTRSLMPAKPASRSLPATASLVGSRRRDDVHAHGVKETKDAQDIDAVPFLFSRGARRRPTDHDSPTAAHAAPSRRLSVVCRRWQPIGLRATAARRARHRAPTE